MSDEKPPEFSVGTRVRVTSGPCAGEEFVVRDIVENGDGRWVYAGAREGDGALEEFNQICATDDAVERVVEKES